MHDEEMERKLRGAALPMPPEGLRAALLSEAQVRLRGRPQRQRQWQWALAVVAGLLVAVNVGFEAHHARRMEALLGPAPAASAVAFSPEAWREQQQMLAEMLGDENPSERGRSHDHGPLSDLPASRALVA